MGRSRSAPAPRRANQVVTESSGGRPQTLSKWASGAGLTYRRRKSTQILLVKSPVSSDNANRFGGNHAVFPKSANRFPAPSRRLRSPFLGRSDAHAASWPITDGELYTTTACHGKTSRSSFLVRGRRKRKIFPKPHFFYNRQLRRSDIAWGTECGPLSSSHTPRGPFWK